MDDRDDKSARVMIAEMGSTLARSARRSAGAFVASLVAHGAFVATLVALPSAVEQRRTAQEIEIELLDPQPTTIEVPAPPEPIAPVDPTPLVPSRMDEPRVAPVRAEAIGAVTATLPEGPAAPVIAAPEVQVPSVGTPSEPRLSEQERQRLGTLVAPSQAASSWVVAGAEGPSQPSGPAGLEATGGRPTIATEAEVERSMGSHLRTTAMARPWLSRTEPSLTPRPDGSLEYRGHAFTARIAPDGSVTFSDRDAVQADEMLTAGPMRFDLTDMAMRGQGQDPYAAEREWFMEHTEEVRARLETEARARERDSALRGVPGRLAAIWNQERPAFLRRRALFRMWDECDEQGDGLDVRRQVIEFIRSQIPRSGPDAFTVEEVRRFNGERDSTMEFDPY